MRRRRRLLAECRSRTVATWRRCSGIAGQTGQRLTMQHMHAPSTSSRAMSLAPSPWRGCDRRRRWDSNGDYSRLSSMAQLPGSAPWLSFLAQLPGSTPDSATLRTSRSSQPRHQAGPHTVCVCVCVCVCVVNTVDQSDLGRFDLAVKSMASRATVRRVWPGMRW